MPAGHGGAHLKESQSQDSQDYTETVWKNQTTKTIVYALDHWAISSALNCFSLILGIKPRALRMQGKSPSSKPHNLVLVFLKQGFMNLSQSSDPPASTA